MSDLPWNRDAACRNEDPEKWFPTHRDRTSDAVAICNGCPVRVECLEEALRMEGNADRTHRVGIWGGLTAGQRARIAKRRREAA